MEGKRSLMKTWLLIIKTDNKNKITWKWFILSHAWNYLHTCFFFFVFLLRYYLIIFDIKLLKRTQPFLLRVPFVRTASVCNSGSPDVTQCSSPRDFHLLTWTHHRTQRRRQHFSQYKRLTRDASFARRMNDNAIYSLLKN